jgi:hypothetical protein
MDQDIAQKVIKPYACSAKGKERLVRQKPSKKPHQILDPAQKWKADSEMTAAALSKKAKPKLKQYSPQPGMRIQYPIVLHTPTNNDVSSTAKFVTRPSKSSDLLSPSPIAQPFDHQFCPPVPKAKAWSLLSRTTLPSSNS